ncbi:2-oxoacid:acceptor oxidoreductase family protein [Paradesulfitobacterium aromaticivorans]
MPADKSELAQLKLDIDKQTWPDPIQIQLSGSGGQGLILAGIILADAALSEGFNVIQTQAYGPEARGGASRAEVILSKELIDYPHVEQPDILLALTQEACDKYLPLASKKALVIVDSLLVENVPETKATVLSLPIIQTAKQDLSKEMVGNIVALGALNSAANLVSPEALEAAVLKRVPKAYVELNKKALEAGKNIVKLRRD